MASQQRNNNGKGLALIFSANSAAFPPRAQRLRALDFPPRATAFNRRERGGKPRSSPRKSPQLIIKKTRITKVFCFRLSSCTWVSSLVMGLVF